MNVATTRLTLVAVVMMGAVALGCEEESTAKGAPAAASLEPAKPASVEAAKFVVDAPSSKVQFAMDAPLEKIYGRAPGAMTGELFVDLNDVTKSSGLVKVDLLELALYQQTREKEGEEFGKEIKDDTQNEHARAWLEIGDDAPKEKREQNRTVEFKINQIETSGPKSFAAMKGDERTMRVKVTGDFRLHGHKTTKTADMDVTVKYEDGKPVSAHFKTVKPFAVGLEDHDVRPREAFGKLAKKTLEAVAPKVASEANVELDFTAKPAS
ncbi:MAG: hypothetical protein ACOC1F_10190 [Myxococcota bacterium]